LARSVAGPAGISNQRVINLLYDGVVSEFGLNGDALVQALGWSSIYRARQAPFDAHLMDTRPDGLAVEVWDRVLAAVNALLEGNSLWPASAFRSIPATPVTLELRARPSARNG
jgi:hypothetical protein